MTNSMTITTIDSKTPQQTMAQAFEILKSRYFEFSGALVAPIFLSALVLWMPQGKILLMFVLPVLWAGQLEMVRSLRAGDAPPISQLFYYFQNRNTYELIVPYAIASGVMGVAFHLLIEYAPFLVLGMSGLAKLLFFVLWLGLILFIGPLIVYKKFQFIDAMEFTWKALKINAAPVGITFLLHGLVAILTLIPFILPLFFFGMPLLALQLILLSEAIFRE